MQNSERYKFITTPQYYLELNLDAEIKEGELRFFHDVAIDNYEIITIKEMLNGGFHVKENNAFYSGITTKIIAHLPKLCPTCNKRDSNICSDAHHKIPKLEGVPLMVEMPNDEEDVERLATLKYANKDYGLWLREGFIAGYKAKQSERKFTEDDILQAFAEGHARFTECEESELEQKADNYLQSLTKERTPVDFIPEMEYDDWNKPLKPKFINGVLQGRWVFE